MLVLLAYVSHIHWPTFTARDVINTFQICHLLLQYLAHMVNCDWWEVGPTLKEEWRFASMMSGALCVMTLGGPVMQWLPALSLASCLRVSERMEMVC